jgi:uncharacterized protein
VEDSSLKRQIADEMKAGMKAGEKVRVGALRMFMSAIRYKEDELHHELSDDEVREVAAKEVKKRKESIEAFRGAGRDELADKEAAEAEVLRPYAPEMLPDDAVEALVDEAIAATGAISPKEMGKVIGFVMNKAKGTVDGSAVQARVRAKLGE